MATQPIHSTYAPHAPYTPKPNIRVAFLSGPSQATVASELAKLPETQQTATLEELEIAGLARDAAELAKIHLSPAMYPAFLSWADAAIHSVSDTHNDNAEALRRIEAADRARDAVHAIPSISPSDYTLKTYLVEIAAAHETFGPLGDKGSFNWSSDPASVVKALDVLAARTYALGGGGSVLLPTFANAARQVFSEATACQVAVSTPAAGGTPLRSLLIERNVIIARLNDGPDLDDAAQATACDELNRIDTEITKAGAETADDAVVKLIALAQIAAEGHELDDQEAVQAIVEARKHFGIGYIHAGSAPAAKPASIYLPDGYDPYMRGLYAEWQRTFTRFAAARLERRMYEKAQLDPATARHQAAEANALVDPEEAGAAAVDYDAKQASFDELANAEYEALQALIRCAAPGPSELATKLKLFQENQMWNDEDTAGLVARLTTDSRRFGHHGPFPQADEKLIEAFRRRRVEAAYWYSKDREPSTIEIEERSNAIVEEVEDLIWATPAATIEGVIVRLRTLFPHLSQDRYADHALIDPQHHDFRRGLAADYRNERILWAAVEDLARIGGVNLSEMGA